MRRPRRRREMRRERSERCSGRRRRWEREG
jgi:hypothetical protein